MMKNLKRDILFAVLGVICFALAAAGFFFYQYSSFKKSIPTDVNNMWVEYYEDGSVSFKGREKTNDNKDYAVFIPSADIFSEPYSYTILWDSYMPERIDVCILGDVDMAYITSFLDFADSFEMERVYVPSWASDDVTGALMHALGEKKIVSYDKNERFLVGDLGFESLAKADTPSFFVTHGENHFVVSKDKAVRGLFFSKLKANLSFMGDKPFQISRIFSEYCAITDSDFELDMPAQYSDRAYFVTDANQGRLLYTLSTGYEICSDFDFLSTGNLPINE